MHSVNNLLKLNIDLNLKKIEFDKVNLSELKLNYFKFKKLENNRKLVDSLPDKGQKLRNQIEQIENVIRARCSDLAVQLKISSEASNDIKEHLKKNELSSILDKFETLLIEEKKNNATEVINKDEQKVDEKETGGEETKKKKAEQMSPEEMLELEQEFLKKKNSEIKISANKKSTNEQQQNYFARKSKPNEKNKVDEKKLKEAKEKVKEKLNEKYSNRMAQMISIDQSFHILKEHEKKVQEFQMQQAAHKLLQGQSIVYDYSFVNKATEENLRYRERKANDENEENAGDGEEEEYLNDIDRECDEDDEYGAAKENNNLLDIDSDFNSVKFSNIDKLHKNETDKRKYHYDDNDFDKVD